MYASIHADTYIKDTNLHLHTYCCLKMSSGLACVDGLAKKKEKIFSSEHT